MIWVIEILNIQQKRTASDKIFRDKAFEIDKNPKQDGYRSGLDSAIQKFFDEKSKGSEWY